MYLHIFFHSHIFSKNINNVTKNLPPNRLIICFIISNPKKKLVLRLQIFARQPWPTLNTIKLGSILPFGKDGLVRGPSWTINMHWTTRLVVGFGPTCHNNGV